MECGNPPPLWRCDAGGNPRATKSKSGTGLPHSTREWPRTRSWFRRAFLITLDLAWLLCSAPMARAATSPTHHWAFGPLRSPPLPTVKNSSWPRTPIDFFVLAKLEEKGLAPTPPADKATLLRRVTFDLHGLPPTPAELQAFLADTSADAFARVVDRLLASPRYGERWARHWLDLARFSESDGFEYDKIDRKSVV